jgi:hypothetical protein
MDSLHELNRGPTGAGYLEDVRFLVTATALLTLLVLVAPVHP